MESKYFAFYIPENKSILMNNIKELIQEEYGILNGQPIIERIDANVHLNDCETILGMNTNYSLNSLVLVKFTLVNDIFINY